MDGSRMCRDAFPARTGPEAPAKPFRLERIFLISPRSITGFMNGWSWCPTFFTNNFKVHGERGWMMELETSIQFRQDKKLNCWVAYLLKNLIIMQPSTCPFICTDDNHLDEMRKRRFDSSKWWSSIDLALRQNGSENFDELERNHSTVSAPINVQWTPTKTITY